MDTVAIWCAFFMCLLAVYAAFSWLPTMLTNEGLSVQFAGYGLTAYNLGGAIGGVGMCGHHRTIRFALAVDHLLLRSGCQRMATADSRCFPACERADVRAFSHTACFVNAVQSHHVCALRLCLPDASACDRKRRRRWHSGG